MAYCFKNGKKLEPSVLSTFLQQLDDAAQKIQDIGGGQPEVVHDARKALKKSRAVLRLFFEKSGIPARAANREIRDIAQELSTTRDDEVFLQTFDRLSEGLPGEARVEWAAIRQTVVDWIGSSEWFSEQMRDDLVRRIRRLSRRATAWNVAGVVDDLPSGFTASYRRARRALSHVTPGASPAVVHEWRKCVKTHGYHVRLFAPLAPSQLEERRAKVKMLSEMLGRYQDLSVFHQRLSADSFGIPEKTAERLRRLAGEEQSQLLDQSLALGRDLFRLTSKAFRKETGPLF